MDENRVPITLTPEQVSNWIVSMGVFTEQAKNLTARMAEVTDEFQKFRTIVNGADGHFEESFAYRIKQLEVKQASCDGCNGQMAKDLAEVKDTLNNILAAAKSASDKKEGAAEATADAVVVKISWLKKAWTIAKPFITHPLTILTAASATTGTVAANWKAIAQWLIDLLSAHYKSGGS